MVAEAVAKVWGGVGWSGVGRGEVDVGGWGGEFGKALNEVRVGFAPWSTECGA